PESAEYATSKEGTIKLDATKKPKQMDATSTEEKVMLGIYKLDGDRYKVCFAPTGKPRPSEFASKPGSGNLLQVWKRKKEQQPREVAGCLRLPGAHLRQTRRTTCAVDFYHGVNLACLRSPKDQFINLVRLALAYDLMDSWLLGGGASPTKMMMPSPPGFPPKSIS